MTANVIKTLKKIQDLDLFEDDLYLIGGTALSYYINISFTFFKSLT